MVNYILCTAIEGKTIVLDVGEIPVKSRGWRARGPRNRQMGGGGGGGGAGAGGAGDQPDLGWAAHLLYLASPVLTCAAAVMIILLGDCESFSPSLSSWPPSPSETPTTRPLRPGSPYPSQ